MAAGIGPIGIRYLEVGTDLIVEDATGESG
jgi:hypothetical protein